MSDQVSSPSAPPPARDNSDGRKLWPVIGFTAIYLAAAVAASFVRGNREFVIYVAVMFALIGIITVVDRQTRFSVTVLWALSVWGLAHMAGGLVTVPESWPINGDIRVLYSWWLVPGYLKYDHAVHAYGFGVTAWVWWQVIRSSLVGRGLAPHPTPALMMVCAAASMGCGAGNEVIEFFATLLVPETNVGGYINTGWDLVANTVGATVATIWIWKTE